MYKALVGLILHLPCLSTPNDPRCLSMTVSISAAERGHKNHKFIKNKWRNRLGSKKLDKLLVTHSSLRSKAKHAALLQKQAEKGDEALLKATHQIKTFWEEEEASGGDIGKTVDWGFTSVGARGKPPPTIQAWITTDEAKYLKENGALTKAFLVEKYVNKDVPLMMRVEVDGDGLEHRSIIGIHYNNKAKSKGWEVVTNLCIVTPLEDADVHIQGHPIPREDDQFDDNAPVDQRENYPINTKLHEWIKASEHNKRWIISLSP